MQRLVLELTQPIVDEIVTEDRPALPDDLDEPLDFTLVFERVEPMSAETAALPGPVDSTPVFEPQQTTSRELDVLDEPLDFTLVFERVGQPPQETLDTPPVTGRVLPGTADAAVTAAVTPQPDPCAAAGVEAVNGEAIPVVNEAAPGAQRPTETATGQETPTPATDPAAASNSAPPEPPDPPAAAVQVTEMPERVPIDYDKLREDLGAVGGALDSFTQKLVRIITAARQEK